MPRTTETSSAKDMSQIKDPYLRKINNERVIKNVPPNIDTLCWKCNRATEKHNCACEWATQGKPVPGWEATPTEITCRDNGVTYSSFHVKHCPKFIKTRLMLDTKEERHARAQQIAKHFNLPEQTVYRNIMMYDEAAKLYLISVSKSRRIKMTYEERQHELGKILEECAKIEVEADSMFNH